MLITQQNLNNKPCVQNNQPNFKGTFVKEALGELDAAGSLSRRVIDAIGGIVEFGADKFLKVTARKLKPEEHSDALFMCYHTRPEHDHKIHHQNLRFTVEDASSGEEHIIDHFVCEERNNDLTLTVNQDVFSVLATLMEKFPQRLNLEGLAEALKKSKQ